MLGFKVRRLVKVKILEKVLLAPLTIIVVRFIYTQTRKLDNLPPSTIETSCFSS
jgi:hypothetical protein